MELITLCGLAIVAFGFWVELEPVIRRFVNAVGRIRFRSGVRPLVHRQKSSLA